MAASIRNFGFVTVTGQAAGDVWHRARRTRDLWDEIVGPAGIPSFIAAPRLDARRLGDAEAWRTR